MKVTIPRRRVVTAEFANALTALCRAKGLDVKHAWPLAEAKRLAADEAKKFEDARADAIERHAVATPPDETLPSGELIEARKKFNDAHRQFVKDVTSLLNAPVEFGIEANSITIAEGALTGDLLEQVMEFVKRP